MLGDQTQQIDNPDVYNAKEQDTDLLTEQSVMNFSVRDPQDFHGHIVYDVKGIDL